jgi:hypothetical protein
MHVQTRRRVPSGVVMEDPQPIQVRMLTSGQLRAHTLADWDRLDRTAPVCPCPRAMATTGGLRGELRVVFAWQDNLLVGAWPMVRIPDGARGALVRAGGTHQVFDGPTLHPDVDAGPVVAALWSALQSMNDVEIIHLTALPADSPVFSLGAVGSVARALGTTTRVLLDTAPNSDLQAESRPDDLSFVSVSDPNLRHAFFLHALDWMERGSDSFHGREQLLSLAYATECTRVFALLVDGEPVGVQIGQVSADTFTVLETFTDPDMEDCGVEGLMLLEVAAWGSAAGLRVLDVAGDLPSDVPWLGALQTVPVYSASLAQPSAGPVTGFRDSAADRLLALTRSTRSAPAAPIRRIA